MIFYLFPLTIFFLSFPSIIETDVNIGLMQERLNTFIQFDKENNQIYNELNFQVASVAKMMAISGENNELVKQLKEKVEYLPKYTEKLNKLSEKTPIPKSSKDVFKQVEMGLVVKFVHSFVETGLMINGLLKTYDIIKKSEEFRQSNNLQETTNTIKKHIDVANKYFQKADNKLYKIENKWDTSIKETVLTDIYLDLQIAQNACERAGEVFKNVLEHIQQTQKSLLSAQNFHWDGLLSSVFRFAHSIYEFAVNPMNNLINIKNLIFTMNAGTHLVNTVGHVHGYYWTQDEIQKLEIYHLNFDTLDKLIKKSSADINLGFSILEEFNQ
ncbi:unnamed protein product [Adineta steineri]|uniref:Uncharacterized protein n=1 Tax=Adineta steineri TaxID=433720 RepID=A0A818ZB15_9BILA|nr:unnamed protein product [Adineta steineri]CAF1505174.1 unnamed protein product [Adineta steineri]CAF3761623.1 unnamed protein product [Adineta steineri]CAF3768853.1 unnamed protein product [Adineta steineri]